jgi:hypothetical protein
MLQENLFVNDTEGRTMRLQSEDIVSAQTLVSVLFCQHLDNLLNKPVMYFSDRYAVLRQKAEAVGVADCQQITSVIKLRRGV